MLLSENPVSIKNKYKRSWSSGYKTKKMAQSVPTRKIKSRGSTYDGSNLRAEFKKNDIEPWVITLDDEIQEL